MNQTETALWIAAIATFVVGDVGTTYLGVLTPGVREANPVFAGSLETFWGFLVLVAIKVLFVTGAFVAWSLLPSPHRIGIPSGLAFLGSVVVGINLATLAVA